MALALVSARYPQPSRMIRTRGLGRVILRRVPAPVSRAQCSGNLPRLTGLRYVFRVGDEGGRGWLYGTRGRESSTAIGYGCQPGGWVGNRIAGAAGLVRDRKDHEVISSRDN